MKKALTLFCLFLVLLTGKSQNLEHKFELLIGAGPHRYAGDLGNGFRLKSCCWYGGFNFNVSMRLNKSFDFGLMGFIGDFNYVQTEEMKHEAIVNELQCVGCKDRVGLGDLKSRLATTGFFIRYKLGNNGLFGEKSKIKPYIQVGIANNRITDRMKMQCVNPGNYLSVNSTLGIKYNFSQRFSVAYNFSIGYFLNDKLDNISNGINDMSMHNALCISINLF